MNKKLGVEITEEFLVRTAEYLSRSIDFLGHLIEHMEGNGYSEIEVKRAKKAREATIAAYNAVQGVQIL